MRKIIFVILFFSSQSWAANYYVDPDFTGGGNNGSFANPWTTLAQVNAATLANGDDLYFKTGTTVSCETTYLNVRWSGTSDNPSIIGAYYASGGSPVHGLPSGNINATPWLGAGDRPTFDGDFWAKDAGGLRWEGAIFINNKAGYFVVENLHFYRTPGPGVVIKSSVADNPSLTTRNSVVKNCRFVETNRQGVTLVQNTNALVENNYVWRASYYRFVYYAYDDVPGTAYYNTTMARISGAGIEISGQGQRTSSMYNVVRNNIVRQSHEGIGTYLSASHTEIIGNTVYDCQNVNIYLANSYASKVYDNLSYFTTEKRTASLIDGGGSGMYGVGCIFGDNEAWVSGQPNYAHEIYGNYVANGLGIMMSNQSYDTGAIGHKQHRIFNNRAVNGGSNYTIRRIEASASLLTGGDRNFVYGNYSFLYRPDAKHIDQTSMPGYVWGTTPAGSVSGNFFTNGPTATTYSVIGVAATNAQINKVALQKTTGWDDLPSTPGGVTRGDFALSGETGSCSTNYTLCDAVGCSEYWPDYYFCDAGGCQPQACETALDCESTPSLCNEADCATYWPTYIWTNGQCLPPGFEPTPFANKPLRPTSLHLPWRPTSTLPPLDTRSGERQ